MRFTSYIIKLVLVGSLLLSGSIAFGQQGKPSPKEELSKAERNAAKDAAKDDKDAEKAAKKAASDAKTAAENAEKEAAKVAKAAAKEAEKVAANAVKKAAEKDAAKVAKAADKAEQKASSSKVKTTSTKKTPKKAVAKAEPKPVKKKPVPLKRGTNPSRQAIAGNQSKAPHLPGQRPGEASKRVGETEAEKTYNDLGYKASIPKFGADEDLSLDRMIQMATAYRLNHDTENAEVWYAQVVASSDDPIHQYFYAQALQSNGRDQLAKAYFDRYADAKGEGDKRGEAFAKTINAKVSHSSVAVRNEREINTEHLDFSPSFYQDGVVFVSSRPVDGLGKGEEDIWIKDNFMSLFVAQPSSGKELLKSADEFAVNLNTDYHEGPLSFDRQGKRLFFTRNTFNKGKRRDDKSGIMRLNIYESIYINGVWSDAVELPWNTDDYEEAHPTLSDDGQTLYFSSNRPGGFGGMDLYMSKFEQGKWQAPVNLGEEVNTKGTEAFPFIHQDGSLYFASNGHGGRGGLDVFVMKPTAKGFEAPRNIGTPFNSEKDDFGYIINRDKTQGYFTSARTGGAGRDDIYSFAIDEPLDTQLMQTICIYASPDAEQLLPGTEVVVTELAASADVRDEDEYTLRLKPTTDADGEFEMRFVRRDDEASVSPSTTYMTDASGKVTFPIEAGMHYQVSAVKDGFADNMIDLKIPKSAQGGSEDCVPMTSIETSSSTTVSLHGKTLNKKYNNVLPNVELTLINVCTGEERTVRSAANGEFTFGCVPCGCEFLVQGTKKFFITDEVMASTLNVDCAATSCAQGGEVVANLELVPDLGQRAQVNSTVSMNRQAPRRASDALGGGVIEAGTVIELKNIYYDLDKFFIREDAKSELDHVVSLMFEYPGMEIELGSHTDSRASEEYNQELAQKRADAARRYIVRRGIDNRRIVARGFGESQLRNRCADSLKCTEEEHQFNRRTEVRIIKVGEDVDVRYKDDGPEHVAPADPSRNYIWK